MKNEDVQFDRFVREKIENFSATPPVDLWENISGELARHQGNRFRMIYRIVAVAAVILLAFIAGWYFTGTDHGLVTEQNELQQSGAEKPSAPEIPAVQPSEPVAVFIPETSGEKAGRSQGIVFPEVDQASASAGLHGTRERYSSMGRLKPREGYIPAEDAETGLLAMRSSFVPADDHQMSGYDREIIEKNRQLAVKGDNHWKVGLHLSPGYSSHSASHSDRYERSMAYQGSSGDNNLAGGFSVQYRTGKKWSLESGIYYSRNGQASENPLQKLSANYGIGFDYASNQKSFISAPVRIDEGKIIMNSTAGVIEFSGQPENYEIAANLETEGVFSGSMLVQGDITQVFNFVEVPLYVRYSLVDSKFDIDLLGGMQTNLLAGNNAYLTGIAGTKNIGQTEDLRSFTFSGSVGVGVSCQLFRDMALSVEPRFSYFLNSLSSNSDVNFRPYRVGIYTGISYAF